MAQDSLHFIPLPAAELLGLLLTAPELAADDRPALRAFAAGLARAYHSEGHDRRLALRDAYQPFDPDRDTATLIRLTETRKQARLNDLLRDVNWALGQAGFRHVPRGEFDQVLQDASDWGIRMSVDFSAFEHLAVFTRGEAHERRTLCGWTTFFQPHEVEVPIYRRLVLVLKLKPGRLTGPGISSDHVYLKLFKDIPRVDVDMLLPGARVRLFKWDWGKLGVGLFSGVATMLWRLSTDLFHFLQQAILRDSLLWGLTAGTLGYGYKSYYDYQQTRQSYHLNLTQSLYFQNLDSNAGVLTRLFDEAEDQQTCTALLAYWCLWRYAGPLGATAEELTAMMDLYLERYAEVPVLCRAGEAVESLLRLGAVTKAEQRYRALPPGEAIQ